MTHLETLLSRYGTEKVLVATLYSLTEERPRSVVEVVAVEIDGAQVGVLTKTQSENFLPLVQKAESVNRAVACRATLRGNSLKADVALHARKAHELTEEEIAELFSG